MSRVIAAVAGWLVWKFSTKLILLALTATHPTKPNTGTSCFMRQFRRGGLPNLYRVSFLILLVSETVDRFGGNLPASSRCVTTARSEMAIVGRARRVTLWRCML